MCLLLWSVIFQNAFQFVSIEFNLFHYSQKKWEKNSVFSDLKVCLCSADKCKSIISRSSIILKFHVWLIDRRSFWCVEHLTCFTSFKCPMNNSKVKKNIASQTCQKQIQLIIELHASKASIIWLIARTSNAQIQLGDNDRHRIQNL